MNSLDMQAAKRSIQTIKNCTRLIASHPTKHSELQVLELMNEALPIEKQTYIVVFKKDIADKCTHVKPLAEARYVKGKVMFTVKPNKQYPNMRGLEDYKRIISDSILSFVDEHNVKVFGSK
ncbi:hypothetical protein [Rosenbergiella epipactidis]|uniref:hypothetical protein n=1 Tax=Rosenbergiella epipactidis TaxID=1544694 RepID=UPI001F4DFFFE|nr:hypothetical protein [Rosenbergiella epipactidis]